MPVYSLSQLDSLALDRVEGNSALYPQERRYRYINEAIRILNLFTGFYQTTVVVPGNSVSSQLEYTVPAGIISPLRVELEGRQLDPVTLESLARDYYTWATDTTANRGPVAHWAPIGITQFVLHPMDATGGGLLMVTGIAEPPVLAAVDQTMVLEDEQVSIISEYVGHRLVLKEGGKTFADSSVLYQAFLRRMKTMKLWLNFKAPRYFIAAEAK